MDKLCNYEKCVLLTTFLHLTSLFSCERTVFLSFIFSSTGCSISRGSAQRSLPISRLRLSWRTDSSIGKFGLDLPHVLRVVRREIKEADLSVDSHLSTLTVFIKQINDKEGVEVFPFNFLKLDKTLNRSWLKCSVTLMACSFQLASWINSITGTFSSHFPVFV